MTGDLYTRRAPAAPSSVEADARTVEVTWSSGADVRRRDIFGEPFVERLSLAPGAVDLSHLTGGPVLDSHDRSSIRSVLGVVERAWVESGQGGAVIRFSETAERAFREVRDGILSKVSVGYSVEEWREETDPTSGERVLTATRWTPREISLVSIPADAGATVRQKETDMTDPQHSPEGAQATPPAEGQRDHQPSPVSQQRTRVNDQIRSLCELAGVERTIADGMIERGLDLEEARREVFETRARAAEPIQAGAAPRVVQGESFDDPQTRAAAMGEAVYSRINPAHQPSEPARQYMGRTLPDLAGECLRTRGMATTGMSPAALVTRALHSTSDFGLILGDTVNRTLRAAYEAAPSGVKMIARQSTARDFRAKHKLTLGEAPTLKKVGESGEITRGSMAESGESYRLETFARVFGITRQAIVNDDLGAFSDLSRRLGTAAAEFEAAYLVDLLVSNPAMSDGHALFSSDHGNLAGTGAAPSVDTLSDARQALRGMKGLDGKTPINATPRYLLAPAALETAAEKLVSEIQAAKVADVNPFSNLSVIVDPRLDAISATAWYLFADPAQVEVIEYSYLESEPGPVVETRSGFDVDGVETKIRLDFGAGIVDFRGGFRNDGA